MVSIYSHLPVPKSQHYLNRYIKLIDYVLLHPNTSGYTERHHILPKAKSMCPQFKKEKWNIIKLTARQHFLAHWMLWKAYGGKMGLAFRLMKQSNKTAQSNRYWKISSKIYEQLKIDHKESISGENNPRFGKAGLKGIKNPNYGKIGPLSATYGLKHSNKVRALRRTQTLGNKNPRFGKNWPKFSCLQCKKENTINMFNWHCNTHLK